MKKRSVIIPCIQYEVGFTGVAPIVDHPLFARLGGIKQLSAAYFAFPSAVHTRMEHALGTYYRTKSIMRRLREDGFIHRYDPPALEAFALLHDVGHGPFSHAIEPVCTRTHKENGVRIVREMRETIESASIPADRVIAMLEKQDPLGAYVSDQNLGTDKIDYLVRDAHHIGISGAPETKRITRFLVYDPATGLGISHEVIEDVKKFLADYAYMYKTVYMNSRTDRGNRMVQMMTRTLLSSGLSENDLWQMTDGELEGRFATSDILAVSWIYERFRSRRLPKRVVSVRPESTIDFEPQGTTVAGISDESFDASRRRMNANWLAGLETSVACLLGIASYRVCAVPPVEEKRFRPKDIVVHSGTTSFSLRARDPELYATIERSFAQFAAVRVAVWEEDLELARTKAGAIAELCKHAITAAAG